MKNIYTVTLSEENAAMIEGAIREKGMYPVMRGPDPFGRTTNITLIYEVQEPTDFYIDMHNGVRNGAILSYEVRVKYTEEKV